MPRVVIAGGGISGLSTAYYLAKAGVRATIVEPRPRLGGVIETERVEGCVIEGGPDSFLSQKPAAAELIRELGMSGEVIGSNDHERVTYVRRRGGLVPLPDGLMMMIPTKVLPLATTRLLTWPTKIRMGLELLKPPGGSPAEDRSVAEFVSAHYGQEAVDYLAEPLLAGIYGGNPEALSVNAVLPRFVELERRYGSLARGVLAERRKARRESAALPLFQTLKGGLQQLVDAVAAAARPEVLRGRVEAIEPGFHVRVDGQTLAADRLVLACEAHSAAGLLGALDPRAGELLAAVPYSSSMTVALGYDALELSGFGFLVPRRERRRLVACTFVGNKFPHRVPRHVSVLRCFLGGTEDAGVLAESDEAVLAAVRQELREILGLTAEPRFARIFRWPRSMAQYTVGHPQRLAELEARLAALPGLYVAGNAYDGIGIPDCIRLGKRAAERIVGGVGG